MTPVIARQLEPLRSLVIGELQAGVDSALIPARLEAELAVEHAEWVQTFAQLFTTVGSAFATHAVEPLAQRAGVESFDAHDPVYVQALAAFLSAYASQALPDRTKTLLAFLQKALQAALVTPPPTAAKQYRQRRTKQSAADDLLTTMDDLLTSAANDIAEEETVAASNVGPLAGASAFSTAYGVDLVKMWQAVMDDRTRPTHAEADGQAQMLEDPFEVGGQYLLVPMDESLGAGPEETRRCRCVCTFDVAATAARLLRSVWEEKYDPNQPRDERGRWGSDGGGGSSNPTDPALRMIYVGATLTSYGGVGGPSDTSVLYEHSTPLGQYTPEREALHQDIVNSFMAKYAGVPSDRQALISGGLPGSGKTSSLSNPSLQDAVGVDTSNYVPVNSDDMKAALIERGAYDQVNSLTPWEHAAFVHEESSALADRVAQAAMANGQNILYDITANSQGSIDGRLTELQAEGYSVRGAFVDVSPDVAVERVTARYERGASDYSRGDGMGGRYVPPENIRRQAMPNGSDYSSYNRLYFEHSKSKFDAGYVILDNSGDKSAGYPRVIESTGGG